jgi:ArsR family transcriptional regulator
MKQIARQFKAFSDETRLRILHLLLKGERCICELMAVLELTQSKVSRHMAYLKNAGFVTDRREGVWMYYSLAEPANEIHACQLRCLGGCFHDIEILGQDEARLERITTERDQYLRSPDHQHADSRGPVGPRSRPVGVSTR